MGLIHTTFEWLTKYRLLEIEKLKKDPHTAQEDILRNLLATAAHTEWGQKYHYNSIRTIQEFQTKVPLSSYEDLYPFIQRMMRGEPDILWPGTTVWFSKSSGTTNDRSKFIPVSKESLEDCHFKAGKDELALYIAQYPDTKILNGKILSIGGSYSKIQETPDIFCGDVSAVMMKNLPLWAQYLRTPSLKTALMGEWEQKLDKLVEESMDEDVTSIAGVPTWTAVVLRKVIERKNAKSIFEVWPNLEVFFHGAVSFEPYRELFKELIPSLSMRYMEAYNASEGFFAIEDDTYSHPSQMMLLADCGIFYEFMPLSELGKENPELCTFATVKTSCNYAVVISTNAGLWRYMLGDTVVFTTLFPHRIKITGRTKHCINVFGEEVMVHNTDAALKNACMKTNSSIVDYTVGPVFMEGGGRGGHQWIIEFEKVPSSISKFSTLLDNSLRALNSDYDAKRQKDIALAPLSLTVAPPGTFYQWMKSRNKLGGQHKVPRLSDTRVYLEELLKIISLKMTFK